MMQTGSRTLVVTDILQVVLMDASIFPRKNAGQLYSLIQYDVPIICFLLILYSRCTGQELSCNAVGSLFFIVLCVLPDSFN